VPTAVPTIWRSEGVRQLLERPPSTRPNGWNLETLDQARIVEGRLLTVSNGDRKELNLYPDGAFVAYGSVEEFLGWREGSFADNPKVNPLALIEFTYNFVSFYSDLLQFLSPRPAALGFRCGFRNAIPSQGPVYLPSGEIGGLAFYSGQEYRAPRSEVDFDLAVAVNGAVIVGEVSFELLVRLYTWFGHEIEHIPYTDSERTIISLERLQSI